jgi:hypothetical protein
MARTDCNPLPSRPSGAPLADTWTFGPTDLPPHRPKASRRPVSSLRRPNRTRSRHRRIPPAVAPVPEGTPRDCPGERQFDSGPARANGSDLPGRSARSRHPEGWRLRATCALAPATPPVLINRPTVQMRHILRYAPARAATVCRIGPLTAHIVPRGDRGLARARIPATKGLPTDGHAIPCGTMTGDRSLRRSPRRTCCEPKPGSAPFGVAKTALAPVRTWIYVRFEPLPAAT